MSQLTEEQYKRLKAEVEAAKTEASKAQGACDQLMKRMVDEFGCDSISEATAKLKLIQGQLDKAQETFSKQLKDYEKKWKERD